MTPRSSSAQTRPADRARLAKALAHPLRARILQRLTERTASPLDLAGELDVALGVVAYHVRMLRDYECVELVRTEQRRGAVQHFYKAIVRPNLDPDQRRTLPSGLRGELAGATLTELLSDLEQAAEAGTLQDLESVVSRTLLELDRRGFTRLSKLLAKAQGQALAIAAESAGRQAQDATDVFPTELGLLHFKGIRADGSHRL
jgi:DNA-binding transcriptional ArsR family regulator